MVEVLNFGVRYRSKFHKYIMESNNIYVPNILLPASVWKKPFTAEKLWSY